MKIQAALIGILL